MSDTSKHDKHAPKIEQATAFTTWQNLAKIEATKLLDESSSAMERYYTETERMMHESSRLWVAQSRAMHEMSRAFLAGVRTMMG